LNYLCISANLGFSGFQHKIYALADSQADKMMPHVLMAAELLVGANISAELTAEFWSSSILMM